MYLAPLNYDRFFKKVFSDLTIAQAFLSDIFGVPVENIEKLERKNRITDRAMSVEFDFRCEIQGKHVVVEMQQWYKGDIIKRFYLYHSLQSVLQLELLLDLAKAKREEKKAKEKEKEKEKTEEKKNSRVNNIYSEVNPVLTVVWMVADKLGFDEDSMTFALAPEPVRDFLRSKLWENPIIEELQVERKKLIQFLDNDEKGMSFLSENRLIFMFQKNIVKEAEPPEKGEEAQTQKPKTFRKWFEFAELSLNTENTEEEFAKFHSDPILSEVMRYLEKESLSEEDIRYITEEAKMIENFEVFENSIRQDAMKIGEKKGREEGLEKGARNEKISLLSRLFAKKLKTSPNVIQEIVALQSNEVLDTLGDCIFSIESIEELRSFLKQH